MPDTLVTVADGVKHHVSGGVDGNQGILPAARLLYLDSCAAVGIADAETVEQAIQIDSVGPGCIEPLDEVTRVDNVVVDEDIAARSAVEDVGPRAADQGIVASAANQQVIVSPTKEEVAAGAADERVVACAAEQDDGKKQPLRRVEREGVVASHPESLDGGRVCDRRRATLNGNGATIDEKITSRCAADDNGPVKVVAKNAEYACVEGSCNGYERCSMKRTANLGATRMRLGATTRDRSGTLVQRCFSVMSRRGSVVSAQQKRLQGPQPRYSTIDPWCCGAIRFRGVLSRETRS